MDNNIYTTYLDIINNNDNVIMEDASNKLLKKKFTFKFKVVESNEDIEEFLKEIKDSIKSKGTLEDLLKIKMDDALKNIDEALQEEEEADDSDDADDSNDDDSNDSDDADDSNDDDSDDSDDSGNSKDDDKDLDE